MDARGLRWSWLSRLSHLAPSRCARGVAPSGRHREAGFGPAFLFSSPSAAGAARVKNALPAQAATRSRDLAREQKERKIIDHFGKSGYAEKIVGLSRLI